MIKNDDQYDDEDEDENDVDDDDCDDDDCDDDGDDEKYATLVAGVFGALRHTSGRSAQKPLGNIKMEFVQNAILGLGMSGVLVNRMVKSSHDDFLLGPVLLY